MDVYARVAKNVEPKKKKLKEAEDSVASMSALLATKQGELKEVLDRVKVTCERDMWLDLCRCVRCSRPLSQSGLGLGSNA